MLQRVVDVLSPISEVTGIVAAGGQQLPGLPQRVRVFRDEEPDLGPLSGLATGLSAMRDLVDAVYMSSCDAPFLRAEFVLGLVAQLGDHDLAIVQGEKHFHPLAAVYRPRIADTVRSLVEERRLRPIFLLDQCDAQIVSEERMREFDPELLSLNNVNTPAEYQAALTRAGLSEIAT